MPEGRRNRKCLACMQAVRRAILARPDRACYGCGGTILAGASNCVCPACRKHEAALSRAHLAASVTRPCLECKEPVGEHRTTHRCKACHKAYRDRKRERKGRRCSVCRGPLTKTNDTYCWDCKRLYQNWWCDYRKGSPEARLLGWKHINNRYVL